MTYSRPSSDEHTSSFPVGSSVMYTCIEGTIKIPGRSDSVKCLPGARWSTLPEPCGRKYLLSLRHSSKEPLAWLHASAPYSSCSVVASPSLARHRPTSHGCSLLLMGAGSVLVTDGVSWMVAGAQDASAPPKAWLAEAVQAAAAGDSLCPTKSFACAFTTSSSLLCQRCIQQNSSTSFSLLVYFHLGTG